MDSKMCLGCILHIYRVFFILTTVQGQLVDTMLGRRQNDTHIGSLFSQLKSLNKETISGKWDMKDTDKTVIGLPGLELKSGYSRELPQVSFQQEHSIKPYVGLRSGKINSLGSKSASDIQTQMDRENKNINIDLDVDNPSEADNKRSRETQDNSHRTYTIKHKYQGDLLKRPYATFDALYLGRKKAGVLNDFERLGKHKLTQDKNPNPVLPGTGAIKSIINLLEQETNMKSKIQFPVQVMSASVGYNKHNPMVLYQYYQKIDRLHLLEDQNSNYLKKVHRDKRAAFENKTTSTSVVTKETPTSSEYEVTHGIARDRNRSGNDPESESGDSAGDGNIVGSDGTRENNVTRINNITTESAITSKSDITSGTDIITKIPVEGPTAVMHAQTMRTNAQNARDSNSTNTTEQYLATNEKFQQNMTNTMETISSKSTLQRNEDVTLALAFGSTNGAKKSNPFDMFTTKKSILMNTNYPASLIGDVDTPATISVDVDQEVTTDYKDTGSMVTAGPRTVSVSTMTVTDTDFKLAEPSASGVTIIPNSTENTITGDKNKSIPSVIKDISKSTSTYPLSMTDESENQTSTESAQLIQNETTAANKVPQKSMNLTKTEPATASSPESTTSTVGEYDRTTAVLTTGKNNSPSSTTQTAVERVQNTIQTASDDVQSSTVTSLSAASEISTFGIPNTLTPTVLEKEYDIGNPDLKDGFTTESIPPSTKISMDPVMYNATEQIENTNKTVIMDFLPSHSYENATKIVRIPDFLEKNDTTAKSFPDGSFEPYAEPVPEWISAKETWGIAWEIHVYGFGFAFTILAIYLIISIIRLWNFKTLLNRRYFIVLNSLMLLLSGSRAVYLLVDAYNSRHTYPSVMSYMLYTIAFPCITSAFSILFLALLDIVRMQLMSPKIQRLKVLLGIILFHFMLSFTTDIILGSFHGAKILLFICQLIFVLWGLTMFVAYLYIFGQLYKAGLKRQMEMERLTLSKLKIPGVRLIQRTTKFTLCLAIKLTLAAAVLGFLCAALQTYAMVGVYGIFSSQQPEAWPWWSFNIVSRLVEFCLCTAITYTATQPFRFQKSHETRKCDTCAFYIAPCFSLFQCKSRDIRGESMHWDDLDDSAAHYDPTSHHLDSAAIFTYPEEILPLNHLARDGLPSTSQLPTRTENQPLNFNANLSNRPPSMLINEQGFLRFREPGEVDSNVVAIGTDDELSEDGRSSKCTDHDPKYDSLNSTDTLPVNYRDILYRQTKDSVTKETDDLATIAAEGIQFLQKNIQEILASDSDLRFDNPRSDHSNIFNQPIRNDVEYNAHRKLKPNLNPNTARSSSSLNSTARIPSGNKENSPQPLSEKLPRKCMAFSSLYRSNSDAPQDVRQKMFQNVKYVSLSDLEKQEIESNDSKEDASKA